MLCITRHESMTIITIGGLGLDHDQLELIPIFSNPQYTGRIVLSWNLLSWISVKGRIPYSFTKFLTTPELSGPFYISPDNYHTRITEYLLRINYRWALVSLQRTSPNCYPLAPPQAFPFRGTGASGNTFPVLFQLDWFFIYSDQFFHKTLYVYVLPSNPQSSLSRCLICWRLLLSGFRSALVNTSDRLN